jgi:hypothetical protein
MTELAVARATQLREQSGFADAGVYDPSSIGGTHVIYVLHDAKHPELYGGLPADPQIPFSYTYWRWIAKPIGLLIALMALLAVAFHYIFTGPKLPQPESREEDVV